MDAVENCSPEVLAENELHKDIMENLSEIICDESAGPRIQKRAAELIAHFEWAMPENHSELSTIVAEEYFVDKKMFLRKRARPQ